MCCHPMVAPFLLLTFLHSSSGSSHSHKKKKKGSWKSGSLEHSRLPPQHTLIHESGFSGAKGLCLIINDAHKFLMCYLQYIFISVASPTLDQKLPKGTICILFFSLPAPGSFSVLCKPDIFIRMGYKYVYWIDVECIGVQRGYKAKTMKINFCVLIRIGEKVSDVTCVAVVLLNIKKCSCGIS